MPPCSPRSAVLSAAIAATLVLTLAQLARAQTTAPAAAETLFRAGREALERGDATTALAKLEESYRLDPAIGTRLNIAVCEDALGQLSAAWQHFEEVVHALPADDARVAIARQHLAELEPRLPRVTLELAPGAPADTHAFVGDIELSGASFGIALPWNPGEHSVEARAGGHQPQRFSLSVHEGDRLTLTLAPGPELPKAAAPAPSAPSPASTKAAAPTFAPGTLTPPSAAGGRNPTLAYVLLGIGGAGLVTGLVTGALALDRLDVVHRECDAATNACSAEGARAADSGGTLYLVTLVALGVAVTGAAGGTYLLLSQPDGDTETLALTPELSPHSARVSLHARF